MHSCAQANMIKQQLRTTAVLNGVVLSLFETLPRANFVPPAYQSFAYADLQIPYGNGERMMTPSEEGLLLQALQLKGHETVLEVGTGTGFLTALLSRLCQTVISIDINPHFIETAEKKLNHLKCSNVTLQVGNAYEGWFPLAPYDHIVFTGGLPKLDDSLFVQLKSNGKIFAVLGKKPALQGKCYTLQTNQSKQVEFIFNTDLPHLVPLHPHPTLIF